MTTLTNGTGAPPAGWDPDEATERMLAQAHAREDHARWLAEADDKGVRINHCGRCDDALSCTALSRDFDEPKSAPVGPNSEVNP